MTREREERYRKLVCDRLGVDVEMMKSKKRNRALCEARQVLSYVLLEHMKLSLYQIADFIGYISHAEVLRDYKRVLNFLELEKDYSLRVRPILEAASQLAREIKAEGKKENWLDAGDLCWFWNKHDSVPVLAILQTFRLSKKGEYIYRCKQRGAIYKAFRYCVYAGVKAIPSEFYETGTYQNRKKLMVFNINKPQLPVPLKNVI